MDIQVDLLRIDNVRNFLINLDKNISKEIKKSLVNFARFVQKNAKQRAPRDTGFLAKTINVFTDKNEIFISVEAPYAYFQEEGFAPHYVHTNMSNRIGGKIGDSSKIKKKGFIYVKRFKPFILPALEAGIRRLPNFINIALEKSTIKSGVSNV